jgi:protocatechuate 3,4-dioxygenase beta subunit
MIESEEKKREAEKRGTGNPGYLSVQRTLTDAAGAFAFEELRPGSYLIRDVPPGSWSVRWDEIHVEKKVDLTEGAKVQVDLRSR